MSNTRVRDLTVGSPFRLVISFAMPLLFGFFFQQLYNFVDAAIVGKTLGASALAAVGTTGSINFMVLGLCSGMCSGFAVPVAQAFGAREEGQMRRYVVNAAYLCAGISLIVGLITGFLSPAILRWMKTPADIIEDANAYISIIFFAIPVLMLYNMAGGIIRALGDSRTPVYFLIVASLINIVLDLFFILKLHSGVMGAAIATVISQAVSGLGCLYMLVKKYPILRCSRDELRPSLLHMRKLLSIGLPMGLQFSITAIGSVAVQTAMNGLGTVYVASVSAANKLITFFICFFDALGTTMATFCGQNLGARKLDRIRAGVRAAGLIGLVYWVFSFAVIALLGRQMLLLFLDPGETEVISHAARYLIINAAFFVPLLGVNIYRLSIQGMGFTQRAMFAGVLEMIARCVVGIVLIPAFGFLGGCFSGPAAWIAADCFLIPSYYVILHKLESRHRKGRSSSPRFLPSKARHFFPKVEHKVA